MTKKKYFLLILILGTLSAIGPFSIDMYLPGFPAIAADLHTSVSKISLSLSSFFIGISVGQLLYGPLLDRFGRKKPLYAGLSLYVLASLGCVLASSVEALIALRFIQALGGCVGMVASRAMVRDIFPVNENARVFSLLMLVIGVSPMIAPTLGGYISTVFGWHYVFLMLTLLGVLILAGVYYVLPEGRAPDTSLSLRARPVIRNFYAVFKQRQFYTYVLAGAMAGAGLYAYISGSPYVFMELFKVTGQEYGWIFATIAMGLIGSSQINSLLLKNGFRSEKIVIGASLCQALTGICLLIVILNGWAGLFGTIGLIFLFLCCQGFVFPNASALALAPFSKNAGTASALMGCLQMGIGAFASAMVSWLSNNTALPMASTMAACATISFCIFITGNRKVSYDSDSEKVEEECAEMIKTF